MRQYAFPNASHLENKRPKKEDSFMKKKIFYRLSALVLFFSILFPSLFFIAHSVEPSDVCLTQEECVEISNAWLKEYYPISTEIQDIIPVSDGEKITSFCVDFITDGTPSGYIMLDAKKYAANNIVSFTFEGQGIYNELFNHYEKSHNTIPDEKLIYATGPLNYAICVDNNQMTFFDSAAGIVSYNVVQNMCSRNRVITESQKNPIVPEFLQQA